MDKLQKPKNTRQLEPLNTPLSGTELQRLLGHRIRSPLIHILAQADSILSAEISLPPKINATIGAISGEAHRALELYDWVLALFELTINPNLVSKIDSAALISTFCYGIERNIPFELLGYRLIWSVPQTLPFTVVNVPLLQRALHLMIRLLGHDLHSSYVQLDTQVTDNELAIQTRTIITDTTVIQADLEFTILEAVARVCGGRFEHCLDDKILSLNLYLPTIT